MDLATFWDCHRRAFAHFGGVPATIVYDRTKTVVKRHVAPGVAVPLHPEAAAFAEHYGFTIDVLAAYRPTGKGRVERQVVIVRDHVLAGRVFDSIAELDGAFDAWLPIRRGQVHRTHGQVIAVRAETDRAALLPLPEQPYLVTDKHLRRVGKDCLVSFEASFYSVPARQVRAGQRVQLQVHPGPDRRGRAGRHHTRSAPTAAAGWPPIPERVCAAPGSSTPPTGTGCPTDTPAPSPWTRAPPRRPDRAWTGELEPLAALLAANHAAASPSPAGP